VSSVSSVIIVNLISILIAVLIAGLGFWAWCDRHRINATSVASWCASLLFALFIGGTTMLITVSFSAQRKAPEAPGYISYLTRSGAVWGFYMSEAETQGCSVASLKTRLVACSPAAWAALTQDDLAAVEVNEQLRAEMLAFYHDHPVTEER
jgi:hypothetical protein